jgi:deazaflavin-dependent oxidoreductase (nitroreductase family)
MRSSYSDMGFGLNNVHERVYRATGGLLGHRFPGLPPILLLDTIGAKTGRPRTTALAYFEDGPNVVIIASKGGSPRNPGWFHNLRAHPDAKIQIGRERRAVHARVAEPDERAGLWPRAVAMHGGYQSYQARTQREIPLVVLEPRA